MARLSSPLLGREGSKQCTILSQRRGEERLAICLEKKGLPSPLPSSSKEKRGPCLLPSPSRGGRSLGPCHPALKRRREPCPLLPSTSREKSINHCLLPSDLRRGEERLAICLPLLEKRLPCSLPSSSREGRREPCNLAPCSRGEEVALPSAFLF